MISNKLTLFCVLIPIFWISLNCSKRQSEHDLIGQYSDKKLSLIEKGKLYLNSNGYRVMGNTLVLSYDSTFSLTTCGNFINGFWSVEGDSVLLFCKRNRWRNDSLNLKRPPNCGDIPQKFFVTDKGDLKSILFTGSDDNPIRKVSHAITWLSKK